MPTPSPNTMIFFPKFLTAEGWIDCKRWDGTLKLQTTIRQLAACIFCIQRLIFANFQFSSGQDGAIWCKAWHTSSLSWNVSCPSVWEMPKDIFLYEWKVGISRVVMGEFNQVFNKLNFWLCYFFGSFLFSIYIYFFSGFLTTYTS